MTAPPTQLARLADREWYVICRCEGLLARLRGLPASACPFPIWMEAARQWGVGWSKPDPARGRGRPNEQ